MTTTASRPTGHPGYSETLLRRPESVATARRLVRCALAAWGLEELADDGALVVSELVTNPVQHARSRVIRLVVSRPGPATVRIGVVDRSKVPPRRRRTGGEDDGGRGLALVAEVSDDWGTDLLPWGKRVWGELCRKDSR
ncbi:ATP-binding protein [Streptomyces sp. RPA4-5]|uniref:ATP-binding protein n=1 Tax=Streptomyces sp. RPA4-5 TaxID=2721245 RepID=UPI00143E953F|nr:ATP-binding protein [Streptomyces sp. RPA4-5]QIY54589.1 ATP-binding protein [Streptomyces sp. RPA4-5]